MNAKTFLITLLVSILLCLNNAKARSTLEKMEEYQSNDQVSSMFTGKGVREITSKPIIINKTEQDGEIIATDGVKEKRTRTNQTSKDLNSMSKVKGSLETQSIKPNMTTTSTTTSKSLRSSYAFTSITPTELLGTVSITTNTTNTNDPNSKPKVKGSLENQSIQPNTTTTSTTTPVTTSKLFRASNAFTSVTPTELPGTLSTTTTTTNTKNQNYKPKQKGSLDTQSINPNTTATSTATSKSLRPSYSSNLTAPTEVLGTVLTTTTTSYSYSASIIPLPIDDKTRIQSEPIEV